MVGNKRRHPLSLSHKAGRPIERAVVRQYPLISDSLITHILFPWQGASGGISFDQAEFSETFGASLDVNPVNLCSSGILFAPKICHFKSKYFSQFGEFEL